MLRAVLSVPSPDHRVYQRLKVSDQVAILLVETGDFFQVELVVTVEGSFSSRLPVTAEVSDGELLSGKMHDIRGAVQAMLEAGFVLPPSPKAT